MHNFTTFERTAPVGDDNDPIRKHMKKFRCQACNKDKFHIPLKTVDGRTVCIHCCMTGKGQDIVLDKRTVDALEAVANRINGTDNYPPKEKLEGYTEKKKQGRISKMTAWIKELFEYEFIVNDLVWFVTFACAVIVLLAKLG